MAAPRTVRELAAELIVLEEYDRDRSLELDDYGSGQRYNELRRRRQELRSRDERGDYIGTPATDAELVAAFDRVGAPRLRRTTKEAELYGSRGVRNSAKVWDRMLRRRHARARIGNVVELHPDPLAGVANVRAELVAKDWPMTRTGAASTKEALRQEYLDRLASAAFDAPEDATRFELWTSEEGSVEPRLLFLLAAVVVAGAIVYLILPYLIGLGVIFAAVRHLTRGTRRRRPKSSWSSLGRTAALMFAAWNSRWLKPASVTRNGRPLRVSVPASSDGEPNPLDELGF